MEKLLSVEEQRHLKILESLYLSESWMTINRLSEQIDLSERTIRMDIPIINEVYAPFKIITSRKEGIKLEYPYYANIDRVYRSILATDISFKLIEAAFFKQEEPMDQLSEMLFLSTSSCYRLITKINQELEECFEIKIGVRRDHIKIIGEEQKIRQFFYLFFSERYTYEEWPFDPQLVESVRHVIVDMNDHYQLNLSFSELKQITLKITINYLRMKQGFDQIITPEVAADIHVAVLKNGIVQEKIETGMGETWKKEELLQLFSGFLFNYVALDYAYIEKKMLEDSLVSKQVSALKTMLGRLAKRLEIPLTQQNEENIITAIYRDLRSESKQKYFLHNQYFFCHHQFKVYRSSFEAILQEEIKNFTRAIERQLSTNELERLIYYITVYWHNMEALMNQRINKLNILVWTSLGREHGNSIKNMIDNRFSTYTKTSIYSGIDFKQMNQLIEEYDLVITNFSQDNYDDNRIVSITSFPLNQDWRRIRERIQERVRQKNNFLY